MAEKVLCRKCEKEIKINALKGCYWCPDCRLRGDAVTKDVAFEQNGGLTEQQVRQICREEIGNQVGGTVELGQLHDELMPTSITDGLSDDAKEQIAKLEAANKVAIQSIIDGEGEVDEVKDWRAQAKELGVPLFQRKKEDVLRDIEAKLKSPV